MTCTELTDRGTEKARGAGVRGPAVGGQVKALVLRSESLPRASTPGSRDSRPAASKDHGLAPRPQEETRGATLRASSSLSTCLEKFSLCSRSLRSLEASATASSSCASSCGERECCSLPPAGPTAVGALPGGQVPGNQASRKLPDSSRSLRFHRKLTAEKYTSGLNWNGWLA